MTIDIGAAAIDRATITTNGYTIIALDNPANESGTIMAIEIYVSMDLSDCKVGTFSRDGANFTPRDYETIGSVEAGSKQTFFVSITCVAGDYIGIYFSAGNIETDPTGYAGIYMKSGDQFEAGEQTYTVYTGDAISVYGTSSYTGITYYFNSKSTSVWTDPEKMIDNILANYAYTSSDSDTEVLDGNTGPGTNLGTITKVEIRAYAYGDDNDRIDLIPVFSAGDGDEHQTTPGVSPGSWGVYQDITEDTNSPGAPMIYESYTEGDDVFTGTYSNLWKTQTFTPSGAHNLNYVKLRCYRVGSPGTLTLSIRATDGEGKPTGNDLATGTFDGNALTTESEGEWIQIMLSSVSLSASTKYAIVFHGGTNSSNKINYRLDQTSPTYSGGSYGASTDSGVTWSVDTTYDFMFEEGNQSVFSWTDIQALDCKVEKDTVSKGNAMYCAKVEVRVTYTPTVGGVTRSYGFIFG